MKCASGILPIAYNSKQICLAWRSPEVPNGNRWGVIGGMCQTGTPKDNAVRELAEEVGYIGPIELHQAFVCHKTGFEYHNFVGIVPRAFKFDPQELYAWETSFIDWFTYQQIQTMVHEQPSNFHKGLILLWKESNRLIETLITETVEVG